MAAWVRGKLLGAGAFGSVNLAMNKEDCAVFAAKSVVADSNSQVALRAIENEITILQSLDSEFVVQSYGSDWTEENGHLIRNLFLEYMPEGCLTDFLNQFARSGASDEHLVRTYTRSIVQGIEYLHRNGIVHCDIKGKNVLVGNGNVKLTDFGSAKRQDCEETSVSVSGTPLWMAPEVAQQVEQGPASDIWSLGCTVVEMATGRAPWSNLAGMNQLVALYHIGCTDALPTVPAWLSPEAHDFLSHCFQRDPRKRWTSTQLLHHPFLTTKFQESKSSPPPSPSSVLQELADSSSDCTNSSVPTLAAPPAFFKRKLFVESPVLQEPDHWWSNPDSGPWIVVRSPKSADFPTPTPQDLQQSSASQSEDLEESMQASEDLEESQTRSLDEEPTCSGDEFSDQHCASFAKLLPQLLVSQQSCVDSSDLELANACSVRIVILQQSNSQIRVYWRHKRRWLPHSWISCHLLPFLYILYIFDTQHRSSQSRDCMYVSFLLFFWGRNTGRNSKNWTIFFERWPTETGSQHFMIVLNCNRHEGF